MLMNARQFQDCAREETVSTQWAPLNADALLVTSRVKQPRNVKVRVLRGVSLAADFELRKKNHLELLKLMTIILILFLNVEVKV